MKTLSVFLQRSHGLCGKGWNVRCKDKLGSAGRRLLPRLNAARGKGIAAAAKQALWKRVEDFWDGSPSARCFRLRAANVQGTAARL